MKSLAKNRRRMSTSGLAIVMSVAVMQTVLPSVSQAQETTEQSSAYYLRINTQIFDGDREFSHSQVAGFARKRVGQESWVEVDYGNGSVVIEKPGKTAVGRFRNVSGPELGLRYNYDTRLLAGQSSVAKFHNTYVRQHLNKGPALGEDAKWSVTLAPADLGFKGLTGQSATVELERDYFRHDGKDLVLIRYLIPAFSYDNTAGMTTVQWGEGVAVADPTFGHMYWNAALHRAVQHGEGFTARPYRFSRTMVAVDKTGKPLMDVKSIPEVKAAYARVYGQEYTEVIGFTKGEYAADQTPARMFAALDMLALSLAENSPNQLGEMAGGTFYGDRGAEVGAEADLLARLYAVPDKFIAAMGGFDNQMKLSAEQIAERTQAVIREVEFITLEIAEHADDIKQLKRKVTDLGEAYRFAKFRYDEIQSEISRKVAAAATPEEGIEVLKSYKASVKRQLEILEASKKEFVAAEKVLNRWLDLQAAVPKIHARLYDIKLKAPSGAIKALDAVVSGLKRLDGPLTVLSTLGNANDLYNAQANIGKFDPANPDLTLSGQYGSGREFVQDILLNMAGIAGNAASGNVFGTVSDTIAFSTGRFTDLYMVIEAAEYAERQSEQAQMEYMLTFKKHINQQKAQWQDLLDDLNNISIYKDGPDPHADGYDHTDPRLDPITGYPKPYWWELWKRDAPARLIALGIDPEAPVGGWPGGVGPEHRPKPPKPPIILDPSEDNLPDYPTAPPRDPATDAINDLTKDALEMAEAGEDPPVKVEPAPWALPEPPAPTPPPPPTPPATPEPDPLNEMMEHADELRPAEDPMIKPYESDFDTDPVVFDPPTFDPVTFEPVTFDPPVWEPPVWEPPVFVPPVFDPPDPSELEWTNFDDEDWPGQDGNLAFGYDNMSGIVATDLSRWAEWLATQNQRQLERLALQAGYPNLASALNDAQNIIRLSQDDGYRRWSLQAPSCGGYVGCGPSYLERWAMKRSIVVLGDILAQSREIFSTGGLTDIGISGFKLSYVMRDYSLQDGDIVDVTISQFGQQIFKRRVDLLNAGTLFDITLRPGVASVEIYAVNEGYSSPNTAAIEVDNVVKGDGEQQYSLRTGETATLRVEANAQGNK